jgi:hypothetical protein
VREANSQPDSVGIVDVEGAAGTGARFRDGEPVIGGQFHPVPIQQ